jgi:hypothetical protein
MGPVADDVMNPYNTGRASATWGSRSGSGKRR